MASYTAVEAAERLEELLIRATSGEEVVITHEAGERLRLVPDEPKRVTQADVDWLRQRRAKLSEPTDLTALIREMRDEER